MQQSEISVPVKTVYIADDHDVVIDGARTWLAQIDCYDFDVVGTARQSNQVMGDVRKLKPDIAVLDVGFPESPSGLTLVEQIDQDPDLDCKPVVTTQFDNYPYFWHAIDKGAKAYIPKSEGASVFKQALKVVAGGGKHVPEHLVRSQAFDEKMQKLSARQLEWAKYFANGFNGAEIGERMRIKTNSTYQYKRRVQDKLMIDDPGKLRQMLGYYFDVPGWSANKEK